MANYLWIYIKFLLKLCLNIEEYGNISNSQTLAGYMNLKFKLSIKAYRGFIALKNLNISYIWCKNEVHIKFLYFCAWNLLLMRFILNDGQYKRLNKKELLRIGYNTIATK